MSTETRDYRRLARGAGREARWTAWKVFGVVLALQALWIPFCIASKVIGTASGVAGSIVDQARHVVVEEFGPKKLFERYQWFKDAAAQADKKVADLKVYEARFVQLEAMYDGVPRSKWARDDREQWSIWRSEYAGVAASFNDLAAEYNAAMVKINFRMTNVGDLPAGAMEPLPREFKPYLVK